ncbi:hypothetical protein ACFL1U_00935 [Patescibacteria group bacterium]
MKLRLLFLFVVAFLSLALLSGCIRAGKNTVTGPSDFIGGQVIDTPGKITAGSHAGMSTIALWVEEESATRFSELIFEGAPGSEDCIGSYRISGGISDEPIQDGLWLVSFNTTNLLDLHSDTRWRHTFIDPLTHDRLGTALITLPSAYTVYDESTFALRYSYERYQQGLGILCPPENLSVFTVDGGSSYDVTQFSLMVETGDEFKYTTVRLMDPTGILPPYDIPVQYNNTTPKDFQTGWWYMAFRALPDAEIDRRWQFDFLDGMGEILNPSRLEIRTTDMVTIVDGHFALVEHVP